MTATVLLLRFAFGAIAAVVLVAFLALPLFVGALAAAYGDRFFTGFLRLFKWLQ